MIQNPDDLYSGTSKARQGWWSGTTGVGRIETVEFPSREGQIKALGGAVDSLGPPMPILLSLSRHLDTYPEGANCDWRAQITVGAGSVSRNILCDWQQGTQINLSSCGQIRVAALSYNPVPGQPYVGLGQTELGISVGLGGAPHQSPRFTQRLPEIVASESSAIVIPPEWAESVNVALQVSTESIIDPYTSTVHLEWIDRTGNQIAFITGERFQGYYHPIPSGARLRVSNFAAEDREATLMWRLSL
jgi:hypothetical protein